MSPQAQHVSEEALSALLDGELGASELRSAEEHLEACADCRAALEGLRRTASLLSGLERLASPEVLADEVSERVRRRTVTGEHRRWGWTPRIPPPRPFLWSMAASVLLLVTLVFTVVRLGMPGWEGMTADPPEARQSAGRSAAAEEERSADEAFAPERAKSTAEVAEPAPAEEELSRNDRSVGEAEPRQGFSAQAVPMEEYAGGGDLLVIRYERREGAAHLGTLRLNLAPEPQPSSHPGIRILCEPDGRRGYGTRANPVRAQQLPNGYAWPVPESKEGDFSLSSREPARLPAVTFGMKGTLVVHEDGTVAANTLPAWVQEALVVVKFRPGMCGNGQPATTQIPFEGTWTPASGTR